MPSGGRGQGRPRLFSALSLTGSEILLYSANRAWPLPKKQQLPGERCVLAGQASAAFPGLSLRRAKRLAFLPREPPPTTRKRLPQKG
jgi:hypothetical protein